MFILWNLICSPECFILISLSPASVKCLVRVPPTSSSYRICLRRHYRTLSTRWWFSKCNTQILYRHLSPVRATVSWGCLRLWRCWNVLWICYQLKENVQANGLKWMICFLETCCLLTYYNRFPWTRKLIQMTSCIPVSCFPCNVFLCSVIWWHSHTAAKMLLLL